MPDIEAVHPPADLLAAYAQGRLDELEMDEIERHLSDCDSCCRTIREEPEDSLIAKLLGRDAGTAAPTTTRCGAERPSAFQVPSSFVVGAGTAGHPHGEPTVGARASNPPEVANLPRELNDHPRYRVVATIGAGGMGAVYRAQHTLMDRAVALKVIRGDLLGNAAMVERFRREVRAAARLAAHPNIVAAYDAEQAGETHMLVMEFIEGTDLAELVERRGPLPVGEACEYARQAALGLQHGFENGMVHRDVKPQNLMRIARGQIKILDFGLARFASEAASQGGMTAEGMVLGSADYIAPEQIDDPHAADIRADLYSLGCTLYFLLGGRPPFPGGSLIQKLIAHREKTPQPLAEIRTDLPPGLARVVERMMAKSPALRPSTPAEIVRALAPFADLGDRPAQDLDLPEHHAAAAGVTKSDFGLTDLDELPHLAAQKAGPSQPTSRMRARLSRLGPRIWWAAAGLLLLGFRVAGGVVLRFKTSSRMIEVLNLPKHADKMTLKLIPAGTFQMGSPAGQGHGFEHPQHEVRITRPFYLGVFEVTQGQYQAVMGQTPSYFKGSADLPVENVSWLDTVKFCNTLSEREGLRPFYKIDGVSVSVPDWSGMGFRLPTEAEWEYACRAGSTTRYSFGDDEARLSDFAWFSGNSGGKTHPVGQKRPNAFGLYDTHGNVWEWCWDWYATDFYKQSPTDDPRGPRSAAYRVFRGGSWNNEPWDPRSALRPWNGPGNQPWNGPGERDIYLGFRVARGK
jgi:formylglycine-generating enzyme required for sulfatase activity/tRNA A-37 threonylcarbamoyl transferase component Bud32